VNESSFKGGKMKKLLAVLGLSVVLSSSLFAISGPYADVFISQVKQNAKYVKYITPQTLNSWIKKDKDFAILDVREPAEWQAGEIDWPGYYEIPRGLADVMAAQGALDPNKIYVVVCATGGRATLVGGELVRLYKKMAKRWLLCGK
jgi:rhodanese-related sulfurtransferase